MPRREFEERVPDQEGGLVETAMPPKDSVVARYLQETRFDHLAPLLQVEAETALLQQIQLSVVGPEGQVNVSPELRKLLTQYKLKLIPLASEAVLGIYGVNRQEQLQLTVLGKELLRFALSRPDLYIFLIHGAAAEALGEKPETKSRGDVFAPSFDPAQVKRGQAYTSNFMRPMPTKVPRVAERPSIDMDVLVVCQGCETTLEDLCEELGKGKSFKGSHKEAKAVVVRSRRRRFAYVAVSSTGQYLEVPSEGDERRLLRLAPGVPFGQLAFSQRSGFFDAKFRLIDWLMSEGDVPVVLLTPLKDREGFRATALDFHPARTFYPRINVAQGYTRVVKDEDWEGELPSPYSAHIFRRRTETAITVDKIRNYTQNRNFFPLVYHWPFSAFPVEINFPEAWDFFAKELRRWAWANKFPLMEVNPPGQRIVRLGSVLEDDDRAILRELSRRTATWFYERIIKFALTNPSALGEGEVLLGNAKSIIEGLAQAFDGDPYATFRRSLRSSENLDGNPIYGMGIFELFPQLVKFLEDESTGRSRKIQLFTIMKNCRFGVAKEGWKKFIDFLFDQTNGDPLKVAQLLTPFSMKPMRFSNEVLRPFDKRFAALDDFADFGVHGQEPVAIINALIRSRSPLTSVQIAEASGLPLGRITAVAPDLRKRGKLVDISIHFDLRDITFGTERERTTGKAVWCLTDSEPEGDETFHFFGTRSKVYVAIVYGRCSTVAEVKAYTAKHHPNSEPIGDDMITRTVRMLETRGVVVVEGQKKVGEPMNFHTSPSWKREIMLPDNF